MRTWNIIVTGLCPTWEIRAKEEEEVRVENVTGFSLIKFFFVVSGGYFFLHLPVVITLKVAAFAKKTLIPTMAGTRASLLPLPPPLLARTVHFKSLLWFTYLFI
jgi:hypothetical protein